MPERKWTRGSRQKVGPNNFLAGKHFILALI